MTELGSVIWAVQMSTVEFHPVELAPRRRREARRVADRPRPDARGRVRRGAPGRRASRTRCSTSSGAVGWPKTSGGNGLHIYVRIEPRWGFAEVREAALAFAREVERRIPDDATTTWWRKDRDPRKVFVDYNQNARDHTIASAYSVRGNRAAPSRPRSRWDELDDVEPQSFTIATVPARFARIGDPHAGIDDARVLARAAARVGRARRSGRGVLDRRS